MKDIYIRLWRTHNTAERRIYMPVVGGGGCVNHVIFYCHLGLGLVPRLMSHRKTCSDAVNGFLQAGFPSCLTNSIKPMKKQAVVKKMENVYRPLQQQKKIASSANSQAVRSVSCTRV